MATTTCDDCGNQVSTAAIACPKCGAPRQSRAAAPGVVTTQQTGKQFKIAQLAGGLMVAAGVVACSATQSPVAGAWLSVLGAVVYLGARLGAWWSHG